MKCRRCDVEMVPGVAIEPVFGPGISDFGDGDLRGQTISQVPGGSLIRALKCPVCGHSVTADGRGQHG